MIKLALLHCCSFTLSQWRPSLSRIKLNAFLRRRYGGMETECLLSLIEVSWAFPLLFSNMGLWDIRALQLFYDWVPSYVISIPWFLAGGCSLVGVWLFLSADLAEPLQPLPKSCFILRRIGAALSLVIWTWMTFSTYFILGSKVPVIGLYFWFSIASLRTMWSAWSVRWPT
jgi:hypothetical protein